MSYLKQTESKKVLFLWICCVIFHIFQCGIRVSLSNVLNSELQEHFYIGSKELGSMLSFAYMTYAFMQLPAGIIIDKFNAKMVAAISCFLMSIGVFAFVGTNIFWIGLLSQVVLCFGASFAFLIALKITSSCFSADKVDLMSSIVVSCGCLGPIVIGLTTAHLSKSYNWEKVICGLGLLVVLLSARFLFSQNISDSALDRKKTNIIKSCKSILSNKNIIFIAIYSMSMLGASSTFAEVWGISFIKSIYCIDTVKATSIISIYFFGLIAGSPSFAFLSKTLKSYKKPMFIGSILLFITLILIVFVKHNLAVLKMLLFLFGFSSSSQMLSFLFAMKLTSKDVVGSVTGVVNTITMLGGTIFVPLVGVVIDYPKNANAVYSSIDYQLGMIPLLVSIIVAMIIIHFIEVKK